LSRQLLSEPLGNLAEFAVGDRLVERVPVRSEDLARRVLRISTSAGDVGLRFDDDRRLRDGDVLYADESKVITVCVRPDDVLVIHPRNIHEALEIAHALGNRHLPAQFEGDAMLVQYDALVEELLAQRDVAYAREERVLALPFRHAHAPHSHE